MTPQFIGYWCGYRTNGTPTQLSQVIKEIHTVPLAFSGITAESTLSTDYLCTNFSAETLQTWAKILQGQGQQVLLTLIDNANIHWNDIDLKKFAGSCKDVGLRDWGLDGFDIDAESPALSTLATFIPILRATVGKDVPISFTGYTGEGVELEVLEQVKDSIDWVQTMAYWEDSTQMKALAKVYADVVGKERVALGVKVGETPLNECRKLAKWTKKEGYRGIMLWSADMDNSTYTGLKDWSWADAVLKGFNIPTGNELLSWSVDEAARKHAGFG